MIIYIEKQLKNAIKVEGILEDQNGNKAPSGTTLIFESNNKFITSTLDKGLININLLPNNKYTVYIKQDTLEKTGEITVEDTNKDIGILKYNKKEVKTSKKDGYNRPDDNYIPPERPSINDKDTPIIILNTEGLEKYEDEEIYIVEEKLDKLTGKITDNSNITKLEYSIDIGKLNIEKQNLTPSKDFTISKPSMLPGLNTLTIKATDGNNNTGIYSIELLNLSEENAENIELDMEDNDGDGLLNYQELYYGTDPNNPDTDEDGLTDYEEIVITQTDPLKQDTDGNGILDPYEDFDNDGLTNIEEIRLNGDPYNEDTDFDGLLDGEEASLGTKLDEWDTDGDGLSDSKEIELGTDPLNPDTNGNGILDGDEIYHTSFNSADVELGDILAPSVSLGIAGQYMDEVTISKVAEDDIFLSSDIPGYIGNAFDFMVPDKFNDAVISFEYNGGIPISEDFVPTLYYFNENTQELEELSNQWINGNIIVAEVSHFSKYILLNKMEFDKVWEVEIKSPNEDEEGNIKPLDIVLVIDSSGSMSWNDPNGIRKQAAKEFINKLGDNDQAAIVDFDDYGKLLSGLTSNKSELHAAINRIDSIGGTAIYSGFQMALDLFSYINSTYSARSFSFMRGKDVVSTVLDKRELEEQLHEELEADIEADIEEELQEEIQEELKHELLEDLPEVFENINIVPTAELLSAAESRDANRYIIILTDGEDNYYYNYNSLIQTAIEKGVTVYTIGLGSSVDIKLLKGIAEGTGGNYYHATTYEDLDKIFDETAEETIDFVTDSNEDGISDYYTQKIYEGILTTGTGKSFKGIDFNKYGKDYDGDGLKNGDELKVVVSGKKVYLKIHSDPTKADTDGDGIGDKEDPERLVYNITDRTLALVAKLSYKNLESKKGKLVGNDGPDELSKFTIVNANDSGYLKLNDFFDGGLGSVAIRISRSGRKDAIILAFRGTEFKNDAVRDALTDLKLGIGINTTQSNKAFKEYRKLAINKNAEFFLVGHSLGGRLVQDVLYKTYDKNDGFLGINKADITIPVHSTTFNALGYNLVNYYSNLLLKYNNINSIKTKVTNYYYKNDLVGEGLGNSLIFGRLGTNIGPWTLKDNDGKPFVPDDKIGYVLGDLHGIDLFLSEPKLMYKKGDNYY